jgi:hypothetical protein
MYALDYLRRWQATDPTAARTIEWVRAKRIDRLQPDEREWFASTFPNQSTGRSVQGTGN